MSYKVYAFSDEDVDNTPRTGPLQITLADIKIDPLSNQNTLIFLIQRNGVTDKAIFEGQFTYNSTKQSGLDVLSVLANTLTYYSNNVITQKEYFDPPQDPLNKLVFGSNKDRIEFFKGDDIFVGSPTSAQDDTALGHTGDDAFTGNRSGQYGDYFDGELGFDKAYLWGKYSEYEIKHSVFYNMRTGEGSVNGFSVTDKIADRDGYDRYANVERLYFSDKVLALDIDGNAGQAYRLYQAALDRTPDQRGLADWINYMDNGGKLNAMSQMFIDSQEFRAKYGALDNLGFVNQLYLNVLDRAGEAKGVSDWVGALNGGALSRAQVLAGFSESAENQANVIGQIKNGIPYVEYWLA